MDWHRIEQRFRKAVADEDRATTCVPDSIWWRRSAIAAILLIAVGVVALWPRPVRAREIAVNPPVADAYANAIVESAGRPPEVASAAPVEEIAVAPSEAADQDNYLVAENIVYRPARVVIASGDFDRQDTPRLPY